MSRNLRRGPATPGLRQTIGAATRGAAPQPQPATRQSAGPMVTRLDSDSLAAHQSATPADNSTGKPLTPTEAGDPTYNDGKASRGVQRASTEELSTDSPLKDPENGGVSTPSDMDLENGREEEAKPGSPMVEGAVMNWFDELGS